MIRHKVKGYIISIDLRRRNSMKRKFILSILLIVILALFLAACNNESPVEDPNPDPNPNNEEEENAVEENELMEDFREIADKNNPYEIKEFIDENIHKVSEEEASEMVDKLDRSLVNNIGAINDGIVTLDEDGELIEIGSTDFFFDRENVQEIDNEKLRQEVDMALDNGYKLINVEGSYNIIVDYARLQEYNDYISEKLVDYLEIRAMDSENPPFADAALIIEYDDLAERILKTEEYLTNYPESIRYVEMLDIYETKLDFYLRGIPNTQIYDYATNEIYDSPYDSFTRTSQVEDSITAHVTGQYLDVIDENDRIIDMDVLARGEELVEEAVKSFK